MAISASMQQTNYDAIKANPETHTQLRKVWFSLGGMIQATVLNLLTFGVGFNRNATGPDGTRGNGRVVVANFRVGTTLEEVQAAFRNDEHIVRLINTALTSEMRTAAMKDWTQLDDPIRVQQVEQKLSEQDELIARLTRERDEAIAAAQAKADVVSDAKRKRASTAATPVS